MSIDALNSMIESLIQSRTESLREYVNSSDLWASCNDPEAGAVFFVQGALRLQTCTDRFDTIENAQKWLDEIMSSTKFKRRYRCRVQVKLELEISDKAWPEIWICQHVRRENVIHVTFFSEDLHRCAILYELARVLRTELLPGCMPLHDREFRCISLDLVGKFACREYEKWQKDIYKELKLPFTAIRVPRDPFGF